ncbi:MAG: 4Fe-4S binding protein [Thermoplasmatota archaeon]
MAKLTHVPFFRWLVKKMVFDKNDVTILTKDSAVEIALNKKMVPPESIVVPSAIVKHFIDKTNYCFIMDFCLCRQAMQCNNYPIDLGCLFMGEAAKKIPKEFGRSVSKKQALEHIELCREAGLVHLIGRDTLDEVWLGVGSKIPLLTICHCCSCCCLWKMLSSLDETLSSTVKKMPGVEILINEQCTGCGKCVDDICFINAITISQGAAQISGRCVGCGRCVESCPHHAIEIVFTDDDFIKKTIQRIEHVICQ